MTTSSYVNAPTPPSGPGDEWTNPDTGVTYQWNGERWIAIDEHEHTEDYVNRTGDSMLGPLIVANPRVASEVTNKHYVDDEIDKVKVEIASIAVEKGSARNYRLVDVTGQDPRANGHLIVNNADPSQVDAISMFLNDIGGTSTRIPEVQDIIELDRNLNGQSQKFRVISEPVINGQALELEVLGSKGNVDSFDVNDFYTVYVYPQNEAGVTQDQLQQAVDLKVDRAGDTMIGDLIMDANIDLQSNRLKNVGRVVFTDNIYLEKVEGTDADIRIYNKAPLDWDKKVDFPIFLDLADRNTYHNRFKIVTNRGTSFTTMSGVNPAMTFSNLDKVTVSDSVDNFISNVVLTYTGDAMTYFYHSDSICPRKSFDNVLHGMKAGQYSNVWIDRSKQDVISDPAVRIKASGSGASDIAIYDSSNDKQISLCADATTAPFISIGSSSSPVFQRESHKVPNVVQVAAPARMGWKYTSSAVPASGAVYYSASSMKFSYNAEVGGSIEQVSGKWSLTPNTYFTVWEYRSKKWRTMKTGHVTQIEYVSNGLSMKHDELYSSGTLQADGTIYYITVGGFLS